MWQSFKHVVTTVEDSGLHTEMENLESEEEDTPGRVFYLKPMSCLGQIRSHHGTEMRPGLLVFDTHFLSFVSVLIYRRWRSYHSRLVVARSFRSIRLGTTSALNSNEKKYGRMGLMDTLNSLLIYITLDDDPGPGDTDRLDMCTLFVFVLFQWKSKTSYLLVLLQSLWTVHNTGIFVIYPGWSWILTT
jgi:hypothetical protein